MPYTWVGGAGVRVDALTGLHYMRERWYDSLTQRFLSRDPIGIRSGANLYAYCNGCPVNLIDPSGLQPGFLERLMNAGASALRSTPISGAGAGDTMLLGGGGETLATGALAGEGLMGMFFLPVLIPFTAKALDPTLPITPCDDDDADPWRTVRWAEEYYRKQGVLQKPFAIGFRGNGLLEQFAAQHGAETWFNYKPTPWRVTVFAKIQDPNQLIFVNMAGPPGMPSFDFAQTLKRKRECKKLTSTDEEVLEIQRVYQSRRKNTFWYSAQNPLEPGFNER
jgi:RHS repeat-associated protein